MNETKKWYQSKTVIGAVIVVVVLGLRLVGYEGQAEVVEEQATNISNWWIEAVGLIGAVLVLYGRLTAKTELTK